MNEKKKKWGGLAPPTLSAGMVALTAVLLLPYSASAEVLLEAKPAINLNSPRSAVTGDFNEDGHLDLVVASTLGNAVSVLIGDGDGNFAAPLVHAAGNSPQQVISSDFNNDSHLDIALANFAGGAISVALGHGNGTFGPTVNFSAGALATSLAAADFNEDGNQDLVVANHGSSTLAVLLGNGLGGFGAPTTLPVVNFPSYVLSADVNNDGHADLLVSSSLDSNFNVITGDGSGGFPSTVTYSLGQDDSIWSMTCADVNFDGNLDLITPCPLGNAVAVFLGVGAGAFTPPAIFSTGLYPKSAVVRDFDDDGFMDIAVVNNTGSSLALLLGDGSGFFSNPVAFPAGSGGVHLAYGDFDEDGKPDLVAAHGSSGFVRAFLNRSTKPAQVAFRRGDADGNGTVAIADAVHLLTRLFVAAQHIACPDAADANDDGSINLGDAFAVLSYLFNSDAPPIPAPGPLSCGMDPKIDPLPDCEMVCP